ncbi:uncharacterized protein [Drosophila suzukii]|uniref:Tf2-1-like SH3-like domain-containing protein n=1 Tax=Drosophila suzukii TaxID=28584 RepID=A0ABM4TZW9_DROSZ
MIAQLTEGDQSSWDELLPEIALAINASVSDSTGYSLAILTQGREPRLPTILYDEVTPGSTVISKDPAGKALQLRGNFGIVRSNLQRASQEQARQYNLRRREWRPNRGDKVWLRQHPLSKAAEGFAAKLAPKYDGPYTVTRFISPNLVVLRRPRERRSRSANISQLKPYYSEDFGNAAAEEDDGIAPGGGTRG